MTLLRSTRGYTMFELLLALTILTILAAATYPSLTRARAASIETSTIASVRTIVSAQAVYASSCGGGFFAPSVAWLRQPVAQGRDAFVGPEFTGDLTDRWGYRLRFTPGADAPTAGKTCNGLAAGKTVREYFVAADPLTMTGAVARGRHFGANASGTVYTSTKRVRPVYVGAPPAPAKPL
jgi:prepilin-type N-terminal cleavage/methylation domain-containing protein